MRRRFLSILLTVAMVFTSIPPLYASDAYSAEPIFDGVLQEAYDNLQALGDVAGIYGFEEAGISLDSTAKVPVIVVLKNKPAPVAEALQQAEGVAVASALFGFGLSLEAKAADDKAVFYQGLNAMFSGANTENSPFMPASVSIEPAYTVNFDYDTALNGVSMYLPANKVAELLEIESVAAVFYDAPIDIPEWIEEDALDDSSALGSDFAGALNKVSSLAMGIPEAHAKGYKGAGAVVGVIDTGADYYHPDLRDAYFWFKDPDGADVPTRWQGRLRQVEEGWGVMVNGEEYRWAYFGFNGYDAQFAPYTLTPHSFPKIAKDIYDPMETTFFEWRDSGYANTAPNGSSYYNNHGTHCSGIIVGRGVNEPHNVVGVAPEAKLISYRLGGPGGSSNIAAAIMCMEEGVKDGVDIFSFSYGDGYARGAFTAQALAINYLTIAYNIIFTHSAGNSSYAYTIGGPDGSPLTFEVGSSGYNGINVTLGAGENTFAANLTYSNRATEFVPQLNTTTNKIDNWVLNGGDNITAATVNTDSSHNFFIMPQREEGPGFDGMGTGTSADWNALTEAQKAEAQGKIVVVARGSETITTIPTAAATNGAAGLVIVNTLDGANIYNWGANNNAMTVNYVPTFTLSNEDGTSFVAALRANEMKAWFLDFNGKDRGTIAASSSRGPIKGTFTIKPEVVTPGNNIQSTVPWYQGLTASSSVATYEARRQRTDAIYDSNGYGNMSGTSMAGPFTAGLLAVVLGEHYKEVYATRAAQGLPTDPLGGQPNPYKTMSAFEVRARLANTANKDYFAVKDFGVHEVGSGVPNIVNAVEYSSHFTVDKIVYIPIGTPDYRFFENQYDEALAEVTSFSFGAGNVGMPDATPRVLTANIYNDSDETKEYTISYEWNYTSNRADQNVNSNGNIPLYINGDKLTDTVTIPAHSKATFTASMQVPATLTSEDIGSHEGYVNLTSGNELYHLPFALTVLDSRPDWYLAGLNALADSDPDNDWFEIRTDAELEELSRIVDGRYGFRDSFKGKKVRLLADMDLISYNSTQDGVAYGSGWNPIGAQELPFEGTFDGNGFVVKNLRSRTETDPVNHTSGIPNYKGLFGHVKNATLVNVYIESGLWHVAQYAAAVVGHVRTTAGEQTLIANCVNSMDVTATGMQGRSMHVGGIVGYAETEAGGTLTIENCVNNGKITAASFVGGILGGTALAAQPGYDGSIIGPVEGDVLITNCVNNGEIQATVDLARAGGIAGYLETNGGSVKITNSTNYGLVRFYNTLTSETNNQSIIMPGYAQYSPEGKYFNALGGIVGYAVDAEVTDSSNFGQVINALPVLMMRTTADGIPLWPAEDPINLNTGGIAGCAVESLFDNNSNMGEVDYQILTEPKREVTLNAAGIVATVEESIVRNSTSMGNVNAPNQAKAIAAVVVDSILENNYRSGSLLLNGAPVIGNDPDDDGGLIDAVIVNFPGIEGVKVEYYDTSWKTLAEDVNDGCFYTMPDGKYTVRVSKAGMSYTFNNVIIAGESVMLDVPVAPITVIGFDIDMLLGVIQSDWVYREESYAANSEPGFNVFDNGTYTLSLRNPGYSRFDIKGIKAGDMVDLSEYLYKLTVPVGISNVWISSADWIVRNATAGEVLTLLKTGHAAKLRYDLDGITVNIDFVLDGSNPFPSPTQVTLNFPGISGITIGYYKTSWNYLPGTFSDSTGFVLEEGGIYTLQARKDGMWVNLQNVTVKKGENNVFDLPVKAITVTGLEIDMLLGVIQSDWVYREATYAANSEPGFNVFDNGTYTLSLRNPGYSRFDIKGVKAGDTVDLSEYFYQIAVPEGISNVRISSADWIVRSATAGDTLTLLKTGHAAKLSYVQNGENKNMEFFLDGSNPFPAPEPDPDLTVEYAEYQYLVKIWNNIHAWATNGSAPFAEELPNIYTQDSILAANAVLNSSGGQVGGAHAQAIRDANDGQAGPPYWLEINHLEMLYWHEAIKGVMVPVLVALVEKPDVEITEAQFAEYVRAVKLWNNILVWAGNGTGPFEDEVPNVYTPLSINLANTALNYLGGQVGGAHAQAIRDANNGEAGPPYWLEKEHSDILTWYQQVVDVMNQVEELLQ